MVSNPGGLVDGVTLANLLVTEPRPRNPALADAMKRIGVVERSGRGVDKIFRGMLARTTRPRLQLHHGTEVVVRRLPPWPTWNSAAWSSNTSVPPTPSCPSTA